MPGRQNIRGAVAQREEGDGALDAVRDKVREARAWFKTVVPAHVNADQFIAIGIGALNRDPDMAAVAVRNPQSFMAALSECARLGLTPGDGYALTFRGNDIVGVVEYTGELSLIYRTGQVRTVIAEVVFTNDDFARGVHPHDPPTFAPGNDGRFPGDKARGEPEGGFAYAVFNDGGTSRVVYMARDEVMLHREAAATKRIWDGPFWKSMWLKTLVHELKKWVPSSPEYLRELMRVMAAPEPPAVDWTPAPAAVAGPAPALASGAGSSGTPSGTSPGNSSAEGSPARGGGKANPAVLKAIGGLLDQFSCMDQDDRQHAVSVLAHRWVERPGELTAAEAEDVRVALEAMRRTAEGQDLEAYFTRAMGNLTSDWEAQNPEAFPQDPQ